MRALASPLTNEWPDFVVTLEQRCVTRIGHVPEEAGNQRNHDALRLSGQRRRRCPTSRRLQPAASAATSCTVGGDGCIYGTQGRCPHGLRHDATLQRRNEICEQSIVTSAAVSHRRPASARRTSAVSRVMPTSTSIATARNRPVSPGFLASRLRSPTAARRSPTATATTASRISRRTPTACLRPIPRPTNICLRRVPSTRLSP